MPVHRPIKSASLILILLFILIAYCPQLCAADAPPPSQPAPAGPTSAAIQFTPVEITHGTLVLHTSITLQNTPPSSPQPHLQNIWVHLTVTNQQGQPLAPLIPPKSPEPVLLGSYNPSTPQSTLSLTQFTHIAQPSGPCILQTKAGTWRFDQPNEDYFLQGVLTFSAQAPTPDAPSITLPKTKIPTNLPPLDPAQTAHRIQELAPLLFDSDTQGQGARKNFSLITDPKTIPWLRALLNSGDPDLKLYALDLLARYDTDEALNAITGVLTPFGTKFDSPFVYAGDTYPTLIKIAACQALARSKHPRALAELQKVSTQRVSTSIKTQADIQAQIAALLNPAAKLAPPALPTPIDPNSPAAFPPQHQYLQILSTSRGPSSQYLFLIGPRTLVTTVKDLKAHLASLPPGSSITWAPGCDVEDHGPFYRDQISLLELIDLCKSHNITFILIPSG